MTGLLAGDTALVTGAASGIGRGIALMLAREGASLALADVDPARGGAVAEEARALGADVSFIESDLSAADAPNALLEAAHKALGNISLFVHSASPFRSESDTALSVSAETWDRMVTVNLRSGFLLGQAVGRQMRDRKIRGRMVFITSLHSDVPRNLPHYSAAKAGLTMTMKELARVLAPHGIRVNAIQPGAIPGGGFKGDFGELVKLIPLGRPGTPDDIAQMALVLLCDRFSSYVTGTSVAVDGGIALQSWIPARE
jgi:3-oxoacyl-[acyl-carrier protein] reductase